MQIFRRRKPETPSAAPAGAAEPPSPFVWVFRRRYRADAPYILPNDMSEVNRLDFQHYLVRAVMQGLYWAPNKNPLRVLDVGTGTGRWAREVARLYPRARVVGIDLKGAPTHVGAQPESGNVTFEQGDILQGLPFAGNSFDLVHQRFLISGIPVHRWQDDVIELARVTAPGGWVELTEAGLSQNNGPALRQLDAWVMEVLSRRNLDITIGSRIDTFLRGARLANVTMRRVPVPLGPHGGRIGRYAEQDYFAAITAMRELIASLNIAPLATYDGTVEAAREEVQHGKVTWAFYVAYGQKHR